MHKNNRRVMENSPCLYIFARQEAEVGSGTGQLGARDGSNKFPLEWSKPETNQQSDLRLLWLALSELTPPHRSELYTCRLLLLCWGAEKITYTLPCCTIISSFCAFCRLLHASTLAGSLCLEFLESIPESATGLFPGITSHPLLLL